MNWASVSYLGFDVESTGTDPWRDRIVTASLVEARHDSEQGASNWTLDPGIPIPKEATAVHGITTEFAQKSGQSPEEALEEISTRIAAWLGKGLPLVSFVASYDLTMLEAENIRHGVRTIEKRLGEIRPIIDPFVIDKQFNRYRRGKRTLEALAAYYGVELREAHTAEADARAAVQLFQRITQISGELESFSLEELHNAQREWHQEQQLDLAAYYARIGMSDVRRVVRIGWPTEEPQEAGREPVS